MSQQFTIERIGEGKLPGRKNNMNCGFKWYFKSDTFNPLLHLNTDIEITNIEFANPIMISPTDAIPTELTIEVQGSCNQCGFCCGYRNKQLMEFGCSHVILTGANKGKCAIWATRDQFCAEHGEDHAPCIYAPNMPVKKFNPNCGYSFIITTPDLVITGQEIIFFEVANFTGHLIEGINIRK